MKAKNTDQNNIVSVLGRVTLKENDITVFFDEKQKNNTKCLEEFLSIHIYDSVSYKIKAYNEQSVRFIIDSLRSCLDELNACDHDQQFSSIKPSELWGWQLAKDQLENEVQRATYRQQAFQGLLSNFQDSIKRKEQEGLPLSKSEVELKELVSIYE